MFGFYCDLVLELNKLHKHNVSRNDFESTEQIYEMRMTYLHELNEILNLEYNIGDIEWRKWRKYVQDLSCYETEF